MRSDKESVNAPAILISVIILIVALLSLVTVSVAATHKLSPKAACYYGQAKASDCVDHLERE